ncbi:secreted protein [Rhodopirellula maiorica SM1]|uniref:Secreted protein n=1 Tax=Rhodopirellula maiorica SM1 TaxID=1265738 RepID=M5RFN1_9BACT|nr:secreted protein [Rhodopirellula maiorica SM1]
MAGTLAASLASPTLPAFAADCGCEAAACDCGGIALPMMGDCGCSGDMVQACPPKHGPIFRSLDAFAGGIEKLLGLDKCRTGGCDAMACDSAMGHMMPYEEHEIHVVPYASEDQHYGGPVEIYGENVEQSAPRMATPRTPQPRIMAPRVPMHMSEPIIRSSPAPRQSMPPRTQAGQSIGSGVAPQSRVVPRTIPTPRPDVPRQPPENTPAAPKKDGGSLFDSLSDPFSEDEVRVKRFTPVRQTQYEVPSVNRTALPGSN